MPKKNRRTKRVRRSTVAQPTVNRSTVRMKVVGVGGAGGNVIMRMEEGLRGVDFVAMNTDIQDLDKSGIKNKIHIGKILTKGMGAGMNPELGRLAAEENRAEIIDALKDSDIIFLAAGFGGGTGSGATHVVAEVAKELGSLTIAVVTKPFAFEGAHRMRIAEEAISKLRDKVDALLVIPNDRIFSIIDNETSIMKAFEKIDDILKSAVQGITEVISSAGIVNVDFADLKTVVSGAGTAIIGVGSATGKDRAVKATTDAINSPLLENSIHGARGVIFCIAGNRDLRMSEIDEAAKIITANVDPAAKIIFGAYNDRKLRPGQLKVTIVAAGFNGTSLKNDMDSMNLFTIHERKASEPFKNDLNIEKPAKSSAPSTREIAKEVKVTEEEWDIPAFLRKKKR